jgi:glutathione synthase/RimK-type ligase-like ATP-grasp enzyme
MTRLAFATWQGLPALAPDDREVATALERRGARLESCVWSDGSVDWAQFDAVVLRSTWDYHLRVAEFGDWLGRLERAGVRVFNPVPLVRWNLDKSYLADLAAGGVPTLHTRRVRRGERVRLGDLLAQEGWGDAVVKPAISASAFGTFRTRELEASAAESRFRAMALDRDVLVQEFCPEVIADGEWSVCFFDGDFSHAALKRPAPGDFRTQSALGGSCVHAEPPESVLRGAAKALAALGDRPLFARVDGFLCEGELRLLELELIEPSLYLAGNPAAAARFASCILKAAGRPG